VVRLVKTDIDSITLFVYQEDIVFNKIVLKQQGKKNEWLLLTEYDYIPDKISYSYSDFNNLVNIDPTQITFKVVFKYNDNIVKEIELQTANMVSQPWQRGIIKLKTHEFLIKAKKINGNKLLIFKNLFTKDYCPKCWDNDLKSSNNTNCPLCGGTGYIDKFSQPFFTWGGPYMNQPAAPPRGKVDGFDLNNTQFGAGSTITLLPDIPINPRDLIYVVGNDELGIAESITQTYFSNLLISQNVEMATLSAESREYKAIKNTLIKELEKFNGIR